MFGVSLARVTLDQQTYDAHYKVKHDKGPKMAEEQPQKEPTPKPQADPELTLDPPQPQVTGDQATPKTGHDDCQHKCKYCGKGFSTASQVNMHINTKYRIILCTDCDKRFVSEQARDDHRTDVHKYPRFHCKIKKCGAFAHSPEELHRHMRSKHWDSFPYRCSQCPYLFKDRHRLNHHLEEIHGRLKLREGKGDLYQCGNFRVANMLIDHSRDHMENVHACKECRWHFATCARLHAHCRSTHDTIHYACNTCGETFLSNDDLCKHAKSKHIILCHICRNTFVSQNQLQENLDEDHAQEQPKSRGEMIEDERAKEHGDKHEKKRKKKRKKKKKAKDDDDDDDNEDDNSTYYPSQDLGDDSQEDPEWVPSKQALRRADEEGDEDDYFKYE